MMLSTLLFCCAPVASAGKHANTEAYYQNIWCKAQAGITEVRLFDRSRVDCLTDEYAIEADFAEKAWKEGVGQAYWYALVTRKNPGILTIVETRDDCRYVKRLREMVRFMSPVITIWETGDWADKCEFPLP